MPGRPQALARAAGMAEVRIQSSSVLRGAGLLAPAPVPPDEGRGAPRATLAPQSGE